MDSVNLSTILRDVRVILDQNAEGFDEPGVGEYTLEMNDVIVESIVPAVQWAHMNAPVTKLKGESAAVTTVTSGALQLPSDFMRLVSLRVKSWNRALSSYYQEDDPKISQFLSGYPGLMPTANNPAMVLRQEGGDKKLILHPFKDNDSVVFMQYIPTPRIEHLTESDKTTYNQATIKIESEVYQAFLYYLAYLVKLSYNEESKFAEQAQAFL